MSSAGVTAVCVLAVENVKLLSLLLALPLHDEAAMLHVLETLEGERLHVVLRSPRWESITEDRIRSNLSKTKNIPPKALIFLDFCCTFAMSWIILLVLICSTKVSEKSDMTKS